MTMTPIFTASGPEVLMRDGPVWRYLDQQAVDAFLDAFERVNAVHLHNLLWDVAQRAGHIPTVSPFRRGPVLAYDSGREPVAVVRDMLRASLPAGSGPEAA